MATRTFLIVGSFLFVSAAGGVELGKEVKQAKRTLNAAFTVKDLNEIRQGTTAEHLAITSSYQFFSQADQLKSLHESKISSYKMNRMQTVPLTKDVVLLTFQADIDSTFRGRKTPSKVQVVETWVKRDGKWLQASYQTTPVTISKD